MNVDGSGVAPIGASIPGWPGSWSPDGTQIAFTALGDPQELCGSPPPGGSGPYCVTYTPLAIYTTTTDGAVVTRVVDSGGDPAFMPAQASNATGGGGGSGGGGGGGSTGGTRTFTRVEENNSAVTYTGTWYSNNMSVHSGGSAVLALDAGSRATFAFNGTAAKMDRLQGSVVRASDHFWSTNGIVTT